MDDGTIIILVIIIFLTEVKEISKCIEVSQLG